MVDHLYLAVGLEATFTNVSLTHGNTSSTCNTTVTLYSLPPKLNNHELPCFTVPSVVRNGVTLAASVAESIFGIMPTPLEQ